MAKKYHYYDNKHKHFPLKKTTYVKRGSRWVESDVENSIISREQTKYVLDKRGLPFERSHRLENRHRYSHNEPYDTFSSIDPTGRKKVTWEIDFRKGYENERKLRAKYYYDKQRYLKRKKGN